jgi:5'-deoxynucleotidase YfbR-like HD superfamily hydrolase
MNFKTLYNAGSVRRYHTQNVIKDQDLAAHQWGVAMICREIMPADLHLIEAALTHDLAESITGDIPYTGKKKYPKLKQTSLEAEREFAMVNSTPLQLTPIEQKCLAWADMFECWLFSMRELSMGNETMRGVADTALEALTAMGPPNKEAEKLMKVYRG